MIHLKWKIGKVELQQIFELECGKLVQSIIPNATAANIQKIRWLTPHFADKQGNLKAHVQSFLIKSQGKNILIDACNGNDKNRKDLPEWSHLQTDFLTRLHNCGVSENDIHIVACTHLHTDHVGWNTRLKNGNWVPTFPNATYLFARKEYEYWAQKPEKEYNDDKLAYEDSVLPIIKAEQAKLVNTNFKIDDNVSFISTPGHTPSHVSIEIRSNGQLALITGDIFHHPCQIAYPDWTSFDTSPKQAIETRKRIVNQVVNTDMLIIGSHFSNPVAGKIVQRGDEYQLKV